MSVLFDITLVALILALALWIAMARDVLGSIIGFVGLGLLLALAWVRLRSVDVALTEAAIGGGATGFLLLRAEARLRSAQTPVPDRNSGATGLSTGLAGLGCAAVAGLLGFAVLSFPQTAPTLVDEAAASLGATGLGNPVTAVLLAYRSLDTLLETVVLFLALLGVWALAPAGDWNGTPFLRQPAAPAPLVFLARTLPPVGIVFGLYVFWEGATGPGGAFQAGTVLAAMGILVVLAGLAELPNTARPILKAALLVGPALFTAIGFLGYVFADGFLSYPAAFAKVPILAIEAALTLSIAVTIVYLVAGRPERPGGRP